MNSPPATTGFTPEIHAYLDARARRSGRRIVPLLVRWVDPGSVLDVGCGLGAWLSVFRDAGIRDVIGIDSPSVPVRRLAVPRDRFVPRDLTRPFDLGRIFDLAVCLEVGEHLPPEAADVLVSSLVRHAPAVLFSAAVPHQGGTRHLNERWPDWWARRFRRRGYVAVDALRDRVWEDPDVEWWYAQNAILYVEDGSPILDRMAGDGGAPSAAPTAHPTRRRMARSLPERRVHPRNLGTRWALADWEADRHRIERGLEEATPPGAVVLTADAERFRLELAARSVVPCPDWEVLGWSAPADTGATLAELDRQRRGVGATHLAFPWPAFWWLDRYPGLSSHLRRRHTVVREDELLLLVRLAE